MTVISGLRTLTILYQSQPLNTRIAKVFTVNALLGVMGLATGLLGARLLGPKGRGELAAIQSWPMLFAALAMLGMPEAVVYFGSRDRNRIAAYVATAISVANVASIAFVVAGWILMPVLLQSQSDSTIFYARVFLFAIPLYALIDLPRNALRAIDSWATWNVLRFLHTGLWFMVLMGGWMVPALSSPGTMACLLLTLQVLFIAPHSLAVAWSIPKSTLAPASYRGPMLRFGIPAMLTILPQMLNLRLDQLLMASCMEAEPLGYYMVAVAWAGASAPLFQSVGTVLFPHISAISTREFTGPFSGTYITTLAVLILTISLAMVAVTPTAIKLVFGTRFSQSIPAAMILVVAGGFSGLNLILSAVLQGFGKPAAVLGAELAGLCVTLGSLAIFLPMFGIVGAAMSSLLAYAFTTVMLSFALVRLQSASQRAGD
jgi:O-antigen/teichoic acid export membrane protein